MQWEYQVAPLREGIDYTLTPPKDWSLEEQLTEWGDQRWELASLVLLPFANTLTLRWYTAVFKRLKKEEEGKKK